MLSEKEFLHYIQENKAIIFKVCNAYMDTVSNREDLFQEILLNAWSGIKNFKGRSKFSTWLYSVALNTAITYYKKEQRQHTTSFADSSILAIAEPVTMNDQLYAMNRAISELSRVDKALVVLYLEDFSHKQISEIMGITPNHVAVKMNRIKIKLKDNSKKFL